MTGAREEVLARVTAALSRTTQPVPPAAPRPVRAARSGPAARPSVAASTGAPGRRRSRRPSWSTCCSTAWPTTGRRSCAAPRRGLPHAVAEQLSDAGSVVVPPGLDRAWLADLPSGAVVVRVDAATPPLSHADLDGIGAVLTGCRSRWRRRARLSWTPAPTRAGAQ